MSSENGTNGSGAAPGRILSLDQVRSDRNATDAKGRKLRHTATVQEAHEIAAEAVVAETSKVNEFYMKQIPPFVAQMINDALASYGLITVIAGADGQPVIGSTTISLTALLERLKQFEASLWRCETCNTAFFLAEPPGDDGAPYCRVCDAGCGTAHPLMRVEFLPKGQAATNPATTSDMVDPSAAPAAGPPDVAATGSEAASNVGTVERALTLETDEPVAPEAP